MVVLSIMPATVTVLMTTMMLMLMTTMDAGAVHGAMILGDPLRGRAFRCNLPSVDFRCNPCRLRSLRSLRALLGRRLAALTAVCRADTVAATFDDIVHCTAASSSRRRCAPRSSQSSPRSPFAGCGHRLGSLPSHPVRRRCRLRRPPARALRRARVSRTVRGTPCTASCTRARTSADPRAGAAARTSGTVPCTTAPGSVRTARRSSAAAAPFRRLRRRRFPLRSPSDSWLFLRPAAVGSHT